MGTLLAALPLQAQTARPLAEAALCPSAGGGPARVNAPGFHPSHVPRGIDLVKVELQSADAVCNDGSRAVIYVRRSVAGARDSLGRPTDNQWVIHLQEGGACNSGEVCVERWCGLGFYDASKMSSRWAPATMGGAGIFLRDPKNQFGNYNQVYAYYCTSDVWSGRKRDSMLVDPRTGTSFTLHFRGNEVVTAIFNELRTGLRNAQGQPLLPGLDQATHIYFTGSSAGSGGIRRQADRIGELVRSRAPGVSYAVITDAGLEPSAAGRYGLPVGAPNDPYTSRIMTSAGLLQSVWDGVVDQSCLDRNPTQTWRCSEGSFVQLNHITSLMFARFDLQDPNVLKDRDPAAFATDAEWARAAHDQLTALGRARQTSPEAAVMTRDPGVYGPMCGIHIALDSNNTFYANQVRAMGGAGVSFYQTLWNWVSGQGAAQAITDKPGSTPASPAFDRTCRSAGGGMGAADEITTVSNASYAAGEVAPGSIATAFGTDLAPEVRVASTLPPPASLMGTRAGIRDSQGTVRVAPLYGVAPTQVNFIVPDGTQPGPATVAVQNGADVLFTGMAQVAAVAPGLYSATATGRGVAAALFLRVAANGQRAQGLVFDASLNAIPIPLGPPGDQVYLQLYGTGFKAARTITATVGGTGVPVAGFAASPEFPGLDQANIGPLPRTLAGRGPVDIVLTADGKTSNAVSAAVQ